MLPHRLTNFEIEKYKDTKIHKDTHWVTVYVNSDKVTYFDSFGVEYISKEIKNFKRSKHMIQ